LQRNQSIHQRLRAHLGPIQAKTAGFRRLQQETKVPIKKTFLSLCNIMGRAQAVRLQMRERELASSYQANHVIATLSSPSFASIRGTFLRRTCNGNSVDRSFLCVRLLQAHGATGKVLSYGARRPILAPFHPPFIHPQHGGRRNAT